MVSAASAGLCCLILVVNEQLVFPRERATQVDCNFTYIKGNKMRSYLWESEYYRSVVCRMSVSGFLLVASKDKEVSFMNSF